MATVTATTEYLERGVLVVHSWSGLQPNDVGSAVEFSRYSDRSIQVRGTWGGATVKIMGSNDGANFIQLNNTIGTAISMTVDGIVGILDLVRYIRPEVTGGSGTSLTATMIARGAR